MDSDDGNPPPYRTEEYRPGRDDPHYEAGPATGDGEYEDLGKQDQHQPMKQGGFKGRSYESAQRNSPGRTSDSNMAARDKMFRDMDREARQSGHDPDPEAWRRKARQYGVGEDEVVRIIADWMANR
jgi:hypothetical protein